MMVEELADLVGRLLLTHRLDPDLAARGIGVERGVVVELMDTGRIAVALDADQAMRLQLLANILIRLEVRFFGDSKRMRSALKTPCDLLDGMGVADRIGDGIGALRVIRAAVENLEGPQSKTWRVDH